MDMQQAISIMVVVYFFVVLFVCFKWVFDEEPIGPRIMLSIIVPYVIPCIILIMVSLVSLPIYGLLVSLRVIP